MHALINSQRQYSSTFHRIIKMKPVDYKTHAYINFNSNSNAKTINLSLVVT